MGHDRRNPGLGILNAELSGLSGFLFNFSGDNLLARFIKGLINAA
jgi:hypothetical protein